MAARRPSVNAFPYRGHPTGWYQVGWVHEVAPGQAVPLHYFDTELVLFRTESGTFHLVDAVCPHLGANIGRGGWVEGDCVVCPYHGWKFNGDGQNVDIPYSDRPKKAARLGSWPLVVVGSIILTWYDRQGRPPTWQAPVVPEFNTYDAHEQLTRLWSGQRMKPQYVAENVVDAPHQTSVHRSPSPAKVVYARPDGHLFHCMQEFLVGAGAEKTWLTPNGPVLGQLRGEAWGVGVLIARYQGTDDSVHLHCQTPIDEEHCDARLTVLTAPEEGRKFADGPSELANRRFKFECYQFDRDLPVWEHLHFAPNPMYTKEEVGPYRGFRLWAEQFYADGQPETVEISGR